MNSGLIVSITSRALGRNFDTPFAPTVISEKPLMSHHPHKSLNYMRIIPTPQGIPISLDWLSSIVLRFIDTLNFEVPSIGSSPTSIFKVILITLPLRNDIFVMWWINYVDEFFFFFLSLIIHFLYTLTIHF